MGIGCGLLPPNLKNPTADCQPPYFLFPFQGQALTKSTLPTGINKVVVGGISSRLLDAQTPKKYQPRSLSIIPRMWSSFEQDLHAAIETNQDVLRSHFFPSAGLSSSYILEPSALVSFKRFSSLLSCLNWPIVTESEPVFYILTNMYQIPWSMFIILTLSSSVGGAFSTKICREVRTLSKSTGVLEKGCHGPLRFLDPSLLIHLGRHHLDCHEDPESETS